MVNEAYYTDINNYISREKDNNMFKAFQTVCILLAFVLSCHAKNCCYPNQFESTVKQVIGMAETTGISNFVTANIALSFDTLGQRIYLKEDVTVNNKTMSIVQLQLYGKGVQYTVQNNKTCSKGSLPQWTNQNCIPDHAVKLPPSTLGMKPSLKVQDYYWKVGGFYNTMTVTSDTCVPVYDQFYASSPGGKTMAVTKVENVTPGIKNPHVFDEPDICKHIQVIEEIETRRPMFMF